MHPKFELKLHRLNEFAVDDLNPETREDEKEELNQEIVFALKRYANNRDASVESQIEIYGMQLQKQKRMQQLYQELQNIDDPQVEDMQEGIPVSYENGQYNATYDNERISVTLGEIMTGSDSGTSFVLDRETVPRSVRKKYLIETAKRELRSYLDEQIYQEEVGSNRVSLRVKEAYSMLLTERDAGTERKGIIAERVIASYFERLQYDTDLDFTFESADIFQDVVQKIDFIIKKRHHERGVQVGENPESAGIQFTINQSPEVLAKKKEQIERAKNHLIYEDDINDILLVLLPPDAAEELYSAFKHWKEDAKPVAIDRYLSDTTKEVLFRNVLKEMYSEEEITHQWENIPKAA